MLNNLYASFPFNYHFLLAIFKDSLMDTVYKYLRNSIVSIDIKSKALFRDIN